MCQIEFTEFDVIVRPVKWVTAGHDQPVINNL